MRWVDDAMKFILKSENIDTVILHARWAFYLYGYNEATHAYFAHPKQSKDERETFYANLIRDAVTKLLHAGKKVVLIYPIPEAGIDVPNFLASLLINGKDLYGYISLSSFYERQRVPLAVLDGITNHANLIRIKPHIKLLSKDQLAISFNGKPLYVDAHHLSVEGVNFIKELLDEARF
jgi:hypothetical protein